MGAQQGAPAEERSGSTPGLEAELRRRLANEDRLTRLATTFVHTAVDDFDEGVRAALAEIGSLEGVDRVNVWLRRDDVLDHRHEWTGPDVAPTIDRDGSYPIAVGGPFLETLVRAGEVHIADVETLSGEWAEERDSLLERGVRCLLAVSMMEDGELMGSISFSSLRVEPIFGPEHVSTLRTASGILAQAFARQRAEQRLAFEARFDSVTGLGNRWSFQDAVDRSLARLDVGDSAGLAVLLFDLDRFKVVNDSLGHSAGDQLLAAVGARLSEQLSPLERIARFGGDEIVVLVEGCSDLDEASERAEQLRQALADPFLVDDRRIGVTASAGIAFVAPGDEHGGTDELLRRADTAMYVAKEQGRDRVERYDDATRESVRVRLDDEIDLQAGVAQSQFELHYQPELELSTGAIVAVEALVRWRHPERGLLTPDRFIPLAEETGLILGLGRWVLEEACRQLAEWNALGLHPTLRINLSARQLNQLDLATMVLAIITDAGVTPSDVCLEITETALMADAELSLAILEQLRERGLRLAIDDFGTGYSSLTYLKRFPVDVIKVDRSFVAGLGVDPDDTAIVRTIISMAEALHLEVTAEGVETAEQLDELIALGCDRAQGYLFARPEPAPAATERLLAARPAGGGR
jgi:diguanylate cyclase (GGDEF)-like protein